MEKTKFHVSKWIFLALSVLMNGFIIFYSSASSDFTIKLNNLFTNAFADVVNDITEKEVVQIPMTDLSVSFSNEETYKYNYLPGYNLEEVPLGSAKQIECSFLPVDTTDKSIQFYTDNTDIVKLNPSGKTLSVVGMKTGTAVIHSKNSLSNLDKSIEVKVVDTVAPTEFEITVASTTLTVGEQQTISFDINGGHLGHNELINFRYYDTRKLTYLSSDNTVATVDEYGVIYPKNPGNVEITVLNNDVSYSKSINMTILAGSDHTPYANLFITGSSVCHDNDMIKDQNTNKNHYQMKVFDGESELNPDDFIWESSNELLVKVDKHGVVRGFRKSVTNDENATITATSKLTGQSATFNIVVKEELPSSMYYWITNNDKETWNPTEYTAAAGDTLTLRVGFNPNPTNKNVFIANSNSDVIEVTNEGTSFNLRVKKEGTCVLNATCEVNPDLKFSISFKVLKAGAISSDSLDDVGFSLRKIIGHASLFMAAEIFTLIAIYMFIYGKAKWIPAVISVGFELFLSGLSELIQHFKPDRHGTIKDIFINFGGALVGCAIVVCIYLVIKIIKNKKQKIK